MQQGGDLSRSYAGSFIPTFTHALVAQYDAKRAVFYAPYVALSYLFHFVFCYCLTVRAVVLQQTIDGKPNKTPSDFMRRIFSGGSARVQNPEVVILLDHRFCFSFKPLGHHKFYQAWRCCDDPNLWFCWIYRSLYAFGPFLSGS